MEAETKGKWCETDTHSFLMKGLHTCWGQHTPQQEWKKAQVIMCREQDAVLKGSLKYTPNSQQLSAFIVQSGWPPAPTVTFYTWNLSIRPCRLPNQRHQGFRRLRWRQIPASNPIPWISAVQRAMHRRSLRLCCLSMSNLQKTKWDRKS